MEVEKHQEASSAVLSDDDFFDAHEEAAKVTPTPPPAIPNDDDDLSKFIIKNTDTGETFDIRELEKESSGGKMMKSEQYSFFPDNFKPEENEASLSSSPDKKTSAASSKLSGLKSAFTRRKGGSGNSSIKGDDSINDDYIEVTNTRKEAGQFASIRIIQSIEQQHNGPIWAMKFSHDGMHLGTGGQDAILRVWKVISSSSSKELFNSKAERLYEGHTAPIIDISWSRSSFILSASMDKTVRLWHVSREDCLHVFQHPDSVPSVDFHPREDRIFLSGCFDNKVRLWDIPDGKVVSWAQTPVMITSACFNPSGSMAVVGLLNGQCTFYKSTEQLSYYTQIECRNAHGPMKNGRKVTGITYAPGGKQILISTNDSRMRLFNVDDYSRICKYKGMVNENLQIKGSFSQDGENVICGSENGHVYIWKTAVDSNAKTSKMSLIKGIKNSHDRNSEFEHFSVSGDNTSSDAAAGISTVACFAPASTYALSSSHAKTEHDHDTASTHFIVVATYSGCIKVFERMSSK